MSHARINLSCLADRPARPGIPSVCTLNVPGPATVPKGTQQPHPLSDHPPFLSCARPGREPEVYWLPQDHISDMPHLGSFQALAQNSPVRESLLAYPVGGTRWSPAAAIKPDPYTIMDLPTFRGPGLSSLHVWRPPPIHTVVHSLFFSRNQTSQITPRNLYTSKVPVPKSSKAGNEIHPYLHNPLPPLTISHPSPLFFPL